MMFQAMFAIITVALITGAVVERIKFSALLVFGALWMTLIYAPVAHWVWGGGWLGNLGILDFAGGTVVHINAGVSALALVMLLRSRKGFLKVPMEPHNTPMVMLGAALLWFGWFGFNAGTWILLSWRQRRPTLIGAATGAVAGLVAITPAAGFVIPIAGIPIGIGAAVVCYYALLFMKTKLHFDDSLDVFAVHGVGGIFGALATGIFAAASLTDGGLLTGNGMQFLKQVVGVVAVGGFAFVGSWLIGKLVDVTIGLRVSETEETVGLDISEHSERAYGGF